MLKIPTFILGGLLILTGLGSYLLQDLGVSIKLSGPLAENAKLTLSDGEESHELDLGYPSSKAAGEQAYWLIERVNEPRNPVRCVPPSALGIELAKQRI